MATDTLQQTNGTTTAVQNEAGRAVTVTPRVDVFETADDLVVLADMPGVAPDGVDVRFENGELTVHGRRNQGHTDKGRAVWEYEVTNYFRSFRVTERVAANQISAELAHGVLTLRLPKAESVKPRRIAVRG